MSALPPKADMCGASSYVRFGPIADMGLVIPTPLCLRRKLPQVVEANLPFQVRHMGDGLLKTVLAKMLVLALLHLFTDGIELIARDYVAEFWKQHCILTRCVRPIHCDESLHGVDAVSLRCGVAADRGLENVERYIATGLMLFQ